MTNINRLPRNIWFISDTHFSHERILMFRDSTKPENPLIRPGFANADEMDALMIQRWNEVIGERDKVYHAGDVAFAGGKTLHRIMPQLKGVKRLIMGNHDGYELEHYTPYFKIQPCWREFSSKEFGKSFVVTHVPVHEAGYDKRKGNIKYNVHGHIHQNLVRNKDNNPLPHYINICVEHTDYRPVHIDDLRARMVD